LHLLAHPLQLHLEIDDHVRGRNILRLRTDGIYLARHLLQKAIEAPARWFLARKEGHELFEVALQSGDLFGDVAAVREKTELLFEAGRIEQLGRPG
jgi:hypothetical protein